MLNYEFPPLGGGGGITCEHVATELVKLGHEVDVLTSLGLDTPERENRLGVNIRRVKVLGRTKKQTASLISMLTFVRPAVSAGREMVRERHHDLVHTHFAVPSGPAGVKISRSCGIPLVLSVHGGDLYDPSKWTSPHRLWPVGRVVRRVLREADLVIAQSTNTAENARKYHRFDGRIEIVPLGLPPVEFEEATRDELGLDAADFVLVTVGRLLKRKGLSYLLGAVARIESDRLKVVVCGDGPERASLAALARELGISERILFVGHVSDERKYQLLSVADVFVMASLHEGFGIVFLEAMSQGLPIISTNVGGQTDFLGNGRNAILVPPERSDELQRAIERYMADQELRRRVASANLSDVKNFEISRIARRHVELYKELLSGHAGEHTVQANAGEEEANE
jgi:glycosyltransferase involved in cell wall biosynthesis